MKRVLSALAGIEFIKLVFRFGFVQKLCRFFLGGVEFTTDVPLYGFTLTCDVFNVRVYTEIKKDGAYEAAMSALIASRLRPGMTAIDVGANIGYYSLLASEKVGASGKVFSVEPDPACVALLKRNISKNLFENIEVISLCLGEKEGDTTLYRALSTGCNSLFKENVFVGSKPLKSHATTIDALADGCRSRKCRRPRRRGGRSCARRCRPRDPSCR